VLEALKYGIAKAKAPRISRIKGNLPNILVFSEDELDEVIVDMFSWLRTQKYNF